MEKLGMKSIMDENNYFPWWVTNKPNQRKESVNLMEGRQKLSKEKHKQKKRVFFFFLENRGSERCGTSLSELTFV